MGSTLEFRVLGPLEVLRESEPLDLGSRQQRALLALLVLDVGHAVAVDQLIDRLWGETPPAHVLGTLQSYVSRLRRILEPDRPPRAEPRVLVSEAPGYVLRADPDGVDWVIFERLTREGHAALAEGRPEDALRTLRETRALWRGPFLADLSYEPFADAPMARFDALRLAGMEDEMEAALALGEDSTVIPELEQLVLDHPLRERPRAQLILALYRTGRQAEALELLRHTRAILREELGIDPSPPLRRLEEQVLKQDPELDWRPVATGDSPQPGGPPTSVGRVSVAEQDASLPHRAGEQLAFVGRSREMQQLEDGLEAARSGRGQVVLVGGEPGVGKTRLAVELGAVAVSRGARFTFGQCYEADGAPAFWPWTQVLRMLMDFVAPGPDVQPAPELAQLLPELRAQSGEDVAVDGVDAGAARARLHRAVLEVLERAGARNPMMIVLDDLHWADADSLQLLEFVATHLHRLPILLMGVYRETELRAGTPLAESLAVLARLPGEQRRMLLPGLAQEAVGRVVAATAGIEPDDRFVEAIMERTDGNPFFISELVRLLAGEGRLASGDPQSVLGAAVPLGVRDVVRRRFLSLPGESQELLQLAAVTGREFDVGLLHRASALPATRCIELLETPESEGIILPVGDRFGTFRFSHVLVRETLVTDMTPLQRARLHQRVAEGLTDRYGQQDDYREVIAEHLWHAAPAVGPDPALSALEQATEVALQRAAFESADSLMARRLELLERLPDALEILERRLALLLRLAGLRMMTRGYAAPGMPELFRRTADLARRIGRRHAASIALHGVGAAAIVGADFATGVEVGHEILRLGEGSDDPAVASYGNLTLGVAALHTGRIDDARRHLAAALEALDEASGIPQEEEDFRQLVLSPEFLAPSFAACAEALAGNDDRLGELVKRARAAADRLGGPFAAQMAEFFSAWAAALARDVDRCLLYANAAVEAGVDEPAPVFRAMSAMLQGWAGAISGTMDDAVDRIDAAHLEFGATQARMLGHFFLGLRAEAHAAAGDEDRALASLEEAMALSDESGERLHFPELLRLRGDLLARHPARRDEAVSCLERAEAIADDQGARALVDRARASRAALSAIA